MNQADVEPFRIDISSSVLDDLNDRLTRARWTDDIRNAGWKYGTSQEYLRELTDYWRDKFDWRKQEDELNKFEQFQARIDGVFVHFIHAHSKKSNSIPLILTHGWPDSCFRFSKVIPMLTEPEGHGVDSGTSFDIVAPSMPGFGFSDRTAISGKAVADLWARLMTEVLGYERFGAAGGDLGTWVTRSLALKYPERVIGIHLTDADYATSELPNMSESEKKFVAFVRQWLFTEGGYAILQSTKPQTLAQGLNDSPVGLAAWILEKFRSWSDCNGYVEARFTKDELITNIMIYWVTGTIASSVRMYFENAKAISDSTSEFMQRSDVPAAVSHFPADIAPLPREWAERLVNLKRFTEMPRGGHFASMEEPELYAGELQEFFTSLEL